MSRPLHPPLHQLNTMTFSPTTTRMAIMQLNSISSVMMLEYSLLIHPPMKFSTASSLTTINILQRSSTHIQPRHPTTEIKFFSLFYSLFTITIKFYFIYFIKGNDMYSFLPHSVYAIFRFSFKNSWTRYLLTAKTSA